MDEIECTKCIYNINSECKIGGWTIPKVGCPDGKAKPMTNADRIRSMGDEELAEFCGREIEGCAPLFVCKAHDAYEHPDCKQCWLDWLKQEVADKDGAE